MRRVGQLHAITDETLQSASLAASWLGFYEKCEQRLPIISIDRFDQAGGRRFPPANIEASRCPTWFRSNLQQSLLQIHLIGEVLDAFESTYPRGFQTD